MRFTFWTELAPILRAVERTARTRTRIERAIGWAHIVGHSFIDVGPRSGPFSIAAVRLGASSVVTLDRDDGAFWRSGCNECSFRKASRAARTAGDSVVHTRRAIYNGQRHFHRSRTALGAGRDALAFACGALGKLVGDPWLFISLGTAALEEVSMGRFSIERPNAALHSMY
jgi:Ribosomal protein L11 methyltransferase (PrmA)